jgi:hypothetical protein
MSGTDVLTRLHVDRGEGIIVAERWQDVEDIIEHNKRLQSEPQRSDWGRHIASIPNIFLEQWLNEEWRRGNTSIRLFSEEFNRLIARKLRDPDWRFLRTDK